MFFSTSFVFLVVYVNAQLIYFIQFYAHFMHVVVQSSNYNRASVCLYVCSRFPPRRLAPRASNFQGLFYDPTNYFFEIPCISRVLGKSNVRYVKR